MTTEIRRRTERRHTVLTRPIRAPRCPTINHGNYDGGLPPSLSNETDQHDEDNQSERFPVLIPTILSVGSAALLIGASWKFADFLGSTSDNDDYFKIFAIPMFKAIGAVGGVATIAHTVGIIINDHKE